MPNYTTHRFPQPDITNLRVPLPDELHVAAWRDYAAMATGDSAETVLRRTFACLAFPIAEGMSKQPAYRGACLAGKPRPTGQIGVDFDQPQAIQLRVVASVAGAVPVIQTAHRPDFVRLVQAFAHRNEPYAVPDSMGACFVSGFVNRDRLDRYRASWRERNPFGNWTTEFRRVSGRKELYQDRFFILWEGAYSGVSAEILNFPPATWHTLSSTIRLHHECAHYFTRRVHGMMHRHLLDELVADYAGIVAAFGRYDPNLFLHFMGLESIHYRQGGRLQNYVPAVNEDDFKTICDMTRQAAHVVALFDKRHGAANHTPAGTATMLLALTQFSLAEIAADTNGSRLSKALEIARQQTQPRGGEHHDEPEEAQNFPAVSHRPTLLAGAA